MYDNWQHAPPSQSRDPDPPQSDSVAQMPHAFLVLFFTQTAVAGGGDGGPGDGGVGSVHFGSETGVSGVHGPWTSVEAKLLGKQHGA